MTRFIKELVANPHGGIREDAEKILITIRDSCSIINERNVNSHVLQETLLNRNMLTELFNTE